MADNYALSYHEILTKVNNKKDKKGKVEVLKTIEIDEDKKNSFRLTTA